MWYMLHNKKFTLFIDKPIAAESQTLSSPPSRTIFQFVRSTLDSEQCNRLETTNCLIWHQTNCSSGFFSTLCISKASKNDVRNHMITVRRFVPNAPLSFTLNGTRRLAPESFLPMSENIVVFTIAHFNNFNTNDLKPLPLNGLLYLNFVECDMIRITNQLCLAH